MATRLYYSHTLLFHISISFGFMTLCTKSRYSSKKYLVNISGSETVRKGLRQYEISLKISKYTLRRLNSRATLLPTFTEEQ